MAWINANGSKGHHRFTLNVWENSTSTASNTSNVGWSLVLEPLQNGWDWNISGIYWSVNVNGVGYSGNIQSYDGYSTVTIASNSLDVAHDNDGSKSIGFSFNINDTRGMSYTPGSCSASGSMALTKIDRYASLTSAPNFNDEENPTITYSNPLGNNVTALRACISLTGSNDDISYRDISKTGTSYIFELTEAERNILRNATTSNSRNVKFFVATVYDGNTYFSILDRTFSIVNGNPIFEDFEYEDTNTTITAITGNDQVLVKGLSTLQVTVPVADKMEAVKEATEKNYVVTIDTINQSANYDDENDVVLELGTVSSIGTQRLNVRAYDSRNNSTLVYKDIVVYDYTKPVINFTAERLNNFEAQTTLKISGSFSSLNIDNVEKNTIQTVQYRYQEIGEQTWSNWTNVTFTITNNEFECNDVVIALDNTKEFILEAKVIDNLSNNTVSATIDVGKSIFFISSNEKECYINDNRILTTEDLTNYDDYITGEVVVGTFFGKPLYRQVLDLQLNYNATQTFTILNANYIDVVVKIDGIIRITAPLGWTPLTFYNTKFNYVYFDEGEKNLYVKNDWSGTRAIIIIEYTKTTD